MNKNILQQLNYQFNKRGQRMLNARMNCFTMGYAASTIGVTPDVFRNSFNPLIEQFYETIEKNARDNEENASR
jgi:hypothetical protein